MASQQRRHRVDDGGGDARPKGGGRVRVYLHAVTDAQATLLTHTEMSHPLQDIKEKSGADVQFDSDPSPLPSMKIVIVRGVPSQIEAAVRLISQETGVEATLAEQAQEFWIQWVENNFTDLDSRAYFLRPVYVNRVPMTRQSISGQCRVSHADSACCVNEV